MGKRYKEKNPSTKFTKFLLIYISILAILMIAFLIYVKDSLEKYEGNQIENYIENVIDSLKEASKKQKIENYIDTSKIKISEFENIKTTINDGFAELLKTKKITYKLNKNSTDIVNPIYDIYADDELILEINLDGTKKENRLGLLSFSSWKIVNITPKMEKGLYTCNISVPNNYEVYVNNKKISDKQIIDNVKNEGLVQISKYVEIPHIIEYEIPDLLKKPNVKIIDKKGNEVEYSTEGNKISKTLDFITAETQEQAKQHLQGKIDILKIAKDWSLYLTDDLSGRLHGFYNISQYLIKDSDISKSAYNWATGVDITFVSSHKLDNPTFTDERVTNFEIYNENAFSCEVYLQKNLILKSGKKYKDSMHEKMYFAYYDATDDNKDNPTWKLVNMQSVVENK